MAHEINNPLNFIEGNLHHLREYTAGLQAALEGAEAIACEGGAGAEERIRALREQHDVDYVLEDLASLFAACDEGVKRTTTIVRDLRSFSRLDKGEASEVELNQALDTTLNLLRGRLTGIRVHRDYGELPLVECLDGQIGQVFMNLVANAAEAMGDDGDLTVRTRALEADRVAVEIEDSGHGIPEEALSRIFEPFFTTKEVGKGTGLGLAISYGVVLRHSGTLTVTSEAGRGTCFRMELPVRYQPAEDPGTAQDGASEGR